MSYLHQKVANGVKELKPAQKNHFHKHYASLLKGDTSQNWHRMIKIVSYSSKGHSKKALKDNVARYTVIGLTDPLQSGHSFDGKGK